MIWALAGAFALTEIAAWITGRAGTRHPVVLVQIVFAWIALLVLASIATTLVKSLAERRSETERAQAAMRNEVDQLQTQNAMLQIVARSVDVTLAFEALAARIARVIPCDRVGLALLAENGQEFQTYTARVREEEKRARPRPEVVFMSDGTAIGAVVRSGEPLIIDDVGQAASQYLDASALHTAGFQSALIVPLLSKGRAVGTINVVSRSAEAFSRKHVDALLPIAELFAVARVAQQAQVALGRFKTMEAMSEQTLSIAADINSALQTIVGHCDLLERGYPDTDLQRDLATIVRQAQRIADLLEKMRLSTRERFKEVAGQVGALGNDEAQNAGVNGWRSGTTGAGAGSTNREP